MALPTLETIKGMKVAELKKELEKLDLSVKGLKADLMQRLMQHVEKAAAAEEGGSDDVDGLNDKPEPQDETLKPSVKAIVEEELVGTASKGPSGSSREKEQEGEVMAEAAPSAVHPSPSPAPANPSELEHNPDRGIEKEKPSHLTSPAEASAAPQAAEPSEIGSSLRQVADALPSSPSSATVPSESAQSSDMAAAVTQKGHASPAPIDAEVKKGTGPSETALLAREESLSGADAPEPAAALVPAPKNPRSATIRVDGFIRPFRLVAAKEMLEERGGGPLVGEDGMWMDVIKTHCYATFQSEECAARARIALHKYQWPERGGVLTADFSPKTAAQVTEEDKLLKKARAASRLQEGGDKTGGARPGEPLAATPRTTALAAASAETQRVSNSLVPPPPPFEAPPHLGGAESGGSVRRKRELGPSPERIVRARRDAEGAKEAVKEEEDEKPAMPTLEELFRSTSTPPKLYWTPVPEDQVARKRERLKELKAEAKLEAKKREAAGGVRQPAADRRWAGRDGGGGGGYRSRNRSPPRRRW